MKMYLFQIAAALLISGCALSSLKVDGKMPRNFYPMYGGSGERNFSMNYNATDSLILLWNNEINGGLTTTSPTFADSLMFINDMSGRIYSFNVYNGKRVGLLKVKGPVYTTPVVHNFNVVFISTSGSDKRSIITIHNYSNGKAIAEIEIKSRVFSELIKTDDGFIFADEDGRIWKYNFRGDEIFSLESKCRTRSSPALKNNIIMFGTTDGEIVAADIQKQVILYKKKIGGAFLGGGSFIGSHFIIGNDNGFVYAIDPSTGKINWKHDTGARVLMTPASAENVVYVGSLGGTFYAFDMSGNELWQTETGGVLNASPLVTNNIIFIPDVEKKLLLLSRENGKLLRQKQLEGRAKLTPVIYNDMLIIGYDNSQIDAYEFYR